MHVHGIGNERILSGSSCTIAHRNNAENRDERN